MVGHTYYKMLFFWLFWIMCTCTGAWLLGLLLLMVSSSLQEHILLNFLIVIPLLSTLVGTAQWLLLRRWMSDAIWWIPACIPSGLLLLALGMSDRTTLFTWQDLPLFFSPLPPYPIFLTCGVGFLAGCCQCVVLGRSVKHAGWWVPVSVLCLGVGWPFGEALGEAVGAVNTVWPFFLGWGITALLSGMPLAWLLMSGRRVRTEEAILK